MNRGRILDNIREALKERPGDTKNSFAGDTEIKKAIETTIPKSKPALLKQFKNELELVSGEFLSANSYQEASTLIARVLEESNYQEFVITQEAVCKQIAEMVVNQRRGIQLLSVIDLEYPKRKSRLARVPVALVEATYAVADTGSIVFLYNKAGSLLPHFLSDCILAIIDSSKIVPHQYELFKIIPKQEARDMVIVTGPSRTADIEKVLILGAHGPRRLVVIYINKLRMEKNK